MALSSTRPTRWTLPVLSLLVLCSACAAQSYVGDAAGGGEYTENYAPNARVKRSDTDAPATEGAATEEGGGGGKKKWAPHKYEWLPEVIFALKDDLEKLAAMGIQVLTPDDTIKAGDDAEAVLAKKKDGTWKEMTDDEKKAQEEADVKQALAAAMREVKIEKGTDPPRCKVRALIIGFVYTHVSKKVTFTDCITQLLNYYTDVLNSDAYKALQVKFQEHHPSQLALKRPLTVAVRCNLGMNHKMAGIIIKTIAEWLKTKHEIDALIYYFFGSRTKSKKRMFEKLMNVYVHGTAKKRGRFMRLWRKITKTFRKKKGAKKGDEEKKDGAAAPPADSPDP